MVEIYRVEEIKNLFLLYIEKFFFKLMCSKINALKKLLMDDD